ncbi:MAG: transposase [Alphaproteobacteria bacterium]|nr:transposase [Alphaproteobacteria bacterium]
MSGIGPTPVGSMARKNVCVSVHALRAARRLAPRRGDRAPHRHRYARVLKELADRPFPSAKTIVLVQDNLNIHSKALLYAAFPAAEARQLVERFEWHDTPKHGSWLDLAEPELGVLSAQCLDRRIPDKQTLIDEIAA